MVYMYHSFLIHSSADGHLGCFHVLAMTNSAAGIHTKDTRSERECFLNSDLVSLMDIYLYTLTNTFVTICENHREGSKPSHIACITVLVLENKL